MWLFLDKNVTEAVAATRNKNSSQPPAALLQPLPVPSHPWSYIHFIPGVPLSNGNNVTLKIIDRFCKAAYFAALTKLSNSYLK